MSDQVGASNELPESEELDALYDRFLIRRQVSQVSTAGLPGLLAGSQPVATPVLATNGSASLQHIALSDQEMLSIRQASACVPPHHLT
jgi:MoxR-like ATPase